MTEELEKKLNELLGMKKQLEDLTANKEKSEVSSDFEKKKRKVLIYFYIYFGITLAIMIYGIIGIHMNTGKYQIMSLFYAILGFEGTVLMKMWYHTITNRLVVLREMKQFELRMTEIVKKNKLDSGSSPE